MYVFSIPCSTVDGILSLSRYNKILMENFKLMGYHNGGRVHDNSQNLKNKSQYVYTVPDVTEKNTIKSLAVSPLTPHKQSMMKGY